MGSSRLFAPKSRGLPISLTLVLGYTACADDLPQHSPPHSATANQPLDPSDRWLLRRLHLNSDGFPRGPYFSLLQRQHQRFAIGQRSDFLNLRSVLFRGPDHTTQPITPVQASQVLVSDLIDAVPKSSAVQLPSVRLRRGSRRWWSNIWSVSAAAIPPHALQISGLTLPPG